MLKASSILRTLQGRTPTTMLGSFSGRLPPFQILIGTILSARSRDEMTERICDALFRKYPDAPRLARAKKSDLMRILRPIGFYRQKSQYLIETSKRLLERHGGRVPQTLEELTGLPGVGRKVANCVLVYAFGKAAIPVDTHVHRISNRLGWVRTKTPEETERALVKLVPHKLWPILNEVLVAHGKAVCRPIRPKCGECSVERWCRKTGIDGGNATDARVLLRRYASAHNDGVRTGDFSTMMALFHPRVELRFKGIPFGPLVGRAAVAAAFRTHPPDDLLQLHDVRGDHTRASAGYGWRRSGNPRAGELALFSVRGLIRTLIVRATGSRLRLKRGFTPKRAVSSRGGRSPG